MDDLHFQTATQLAALIRDRKISSADLLDCFLSRVERYNPELNAIIWMDVDGARRRARDADAALAKGENWGPLHGLPMTIKESYQLAGSPTTWGDPDLRENVTDTTALSVQRLQGAGANIFGKTNVPLNLADWQSYNAIHGTANNPWDLSRTPGGSSGGSAAALASGLTGLDAGSDIGASIRNPAHYCGIFGLKPTYGIIPPRGQARPGVVAPADISVIGPMARGASDLRLGLDVMAGPDLLQEAGWRLDLPQATQESLKDFRVAVKLSDPNSEVDAAYADALQNLADKLAKAGATVNDNAHPDIDTRRLHDVYVTLLRAATSTRLSDADFAQWLSVADTLGADDGSYYAMMARANTMRHREWLVLNNERHAMRFAFSEFFKDWDILLCPAAASAAWPHDQVGERQDRTIPVNGKPVPTTDQLFWAGFSGVVYLPSTVGPAQILSSGLPVGYQAIADYCADHTAIRFSECVEREIGGFVQPPDFP
ncbi:MAG: amidase [Hyphomicrobiaceae bacterium]